MAERNKENYWAANAITSVMVPLLPALNRKFKIITHLSQCVCKTRREAFARTPCQMLYINFETKSAIPAHKAFGWVWRAPGGPAGPAQPPGPVLAGAAPQEGHSVQPRTQLTDWSSYLETSFPVWVLLVAWWGALSSACLSCMSWLNSLNWPQASLISSHRWGWPMAPTGVPSLLCPPRWDALGWHWGQCLAPIGLPGSAGWCQLVLHSTTAVGAPPTAFLVLSKCRAQETGEIKIWQGIPVHGCICIFVPLSRWPFKDLQIWETVVVFRCCLRCLSVISVSCYMKSAYCWKPPFVAVMFNCTARYATRARLFSEIYFSTICEKSPVTGEE